MLPGTWGSCWTLNRLHSKAGTRHLPKAPSLAVLAPILVPAPFPLMFDRKRESYSHWESFRPTGVVTWLTSKLPGDRYTMQAVPWSPPHLLSSGCQPSSATSHRVTASLLKAGTCPVHHFILSLQHSAWPTATLGM